MKKTAGQALITLLFFTLIGITISSAAVIILMTNSLSSTKLQEGVVAYEIAKSGAENAKLRLLRDPSYQGEALNVGDGVATISVSSGGGAFISTSSGQAGNFKKNVQIRATYQNYVFTFSPMEEVY